MNERQTRRRRVTTSGVVAASVATLTALIWIGEAMAGGDEAAASALPEGAVEVGGGKAQLPLGRDADGCMMYQLHAPGQMVAQAISYRRADGSFTHDKGEAACGEDEPRP